MWFAAVCSLMCSTRPISRFERPRAISHEDLDLAGAQAVGAARRSRRLDVGVELGRATGERGQPDRPGEAERDPELAASMGPVVVASARLAACARTSTPCGRATSAPRAAC